ncbi:MAG: cytochrome P450 [Paracoccaceae bacterium]
MAPIPPKPASRTGRFAFWRYVRNFRRDILSANPDRLYDAKMAEMKLPFLHSFLVNDPALWRRVLDEDAAHFPKAERLAAGLEPLLGQGVFISNGALWQSQRRIIDPAFEGGRLRDVFPAMVEAGEAMTRRLRGLADGTPVEIEAQTSHATADVIFRAMFSVPIEDRAAAAVFQAFKTYQRTQPLLSLGAMLRLPRWLRHLLPSGLPRSKGRESRKAAGTIRALIAQLVTARQAEIAAGTAPDDLATKIMTQRDPQTGATLDAQSTVDQVAVFFLAGHETSASALAWALYCVAIDPPTQEALRAESRDVLHPAMTLGDVGRLRLARDVFREALRLYPPVPMMVRDAARADLFRGRTVPKGAQVVISPWHLGRHRATWTEPDAFCPHRWQTDAGKTASRAGFIPFSAGARACPGAGFAMIEGPLLLAMILRDFRVTPLADRVPVPVAQLTVRGRDGIWLALDSCSEPADFTRP